VSSTPREIDLEKIWNYDSALMTHDFIPIAMDAPHVENTPLAKNNNPLTKNLGAEPIINKNVGAPLINE
jgi:hypothetical protein